MFANPGANRELVKDCEALLAAKDTLRGTATLNWSTGTAMSSWTGVTTGGTPTRVTGLSLPSKSMTGTIPPQVGHLLALTTLNLKSNSLTGVLMHEFGHTLGLGHTAVSGAIMAGLVSPNLADEDVQGLRATYAHHRDDH